MNNCIVAPIVDADRADWRPLFDGYAEFYGMEMGDDTADVVFSWLVDPDHVLEGLIARNPEGNAVGIAHVRACPRPLGGCEIGFLDDLFVAPESRGSGAADALFDALGKLAQTRNWASIRWITQHFNARGRAFYDHYTNGPTDFIVYQWNPS